MILDAKFDSWSAGDSYECYMGRWSRLLAGAFVDWLAPDDQLDWLELGCGTGALTSTILSKAVPKTLVVTDLSADFLAHVRDRIDDPRARFETADAQSLRFEADRFDLVASALTFNFIPDKLAALAEMRRVTRRDGTLAFYVWDYPGGGIGFIDHFWAAAAEFDPAAAALDEAARFPFCTPDGLRALCAGAGIEIAEIVAIETESIFEDFEALWLPFTMGAGPAPGYCKSLDAEARARLKARLAEMTDTGGAIRLPARAWAVRATAGM